MKTGTVNLSELKKNGLILSARYYLDRCANCGGGKDDPRRHQNGMCGQYKRVFVPTGTQWKDGNAR
jgi:hypothetical protein